MRTLSSALSAGAPRDDASLEAPPTAPEPGGVALTGSAACRPATVAQSATDRDRMLAAWFIPSPYRVMAGAASLVMALIKGLVNRRSPF
jgi:hypothetical protein